MKKRVLLIQPFVKPFVTRTILRYSSPFHRFFTFEFLDKVMVAAPLGLECVAASVEDLVDVKIIDAKAEKLDVDDIKKETDSFQPDIVGISLSPSASAYSALDVSKAVKEVNKEVLLVLGGHHATFDASNLLQHSTIDVVVRGEGELTFRELITKGKTKSVLGLSWKKNGKIIHNPDRPLIEDLDQTPFPARHLLDQSKYHFWGIPTDAIETSRGCPYSCTFCCVHKFYGTRWRARSPKRIVNEVEQVVEKYGKKNVFFTDDNFCLDMKRVEHTCDLIIEKQLDTTFFCHARVDSIANHPKVVEKMKKAGFWMILLGIESPHQQNLDMIKKNIREAQIERAIKILKDNEICIYGAFILGFPHETKEMIRETIDYAKKFDLEMAQFTILTPLLGSELFEKCKEEKLLTSDKWSDFNMTTPVMKTNVSNRDLIMMWESAYRQYYFRPTYILRRFFSRNNLLRRIITHTIRKGIRTLVSKWLKII